MNTRIVENGWRLMAIHRNLHPVPILSVSSSRNVTGVVAIHNDESGRSPWIQQCVVIHDVEVRFSAFDGLNYFKRNNEYFTTSNFEFILSMDEYDTTEKEGFDLIISA